MKFLMRVGLFYIFLVMFSIQLLLAHSGRSQTLESINVTIELRNENLKKLFKKIEKQTGLMFAYQPQQVYGKSITLPMQTRSVKATLDIALEGTTLEYRQVNNSVIIFSQDEKFQNTASEKLAITVTGKVSDQGGNPMPGVNVVQKGTTNGTTTDVNGIYSLAVSENNVVLVFSFIGYIAQEVTVDGRSVIDVVMVEDITSLDEVVIIGYGTQKRRDFTGSVGSLQMEDSPVSLLPNLNVFETLRGTVSGLNIGAVNSAGGDPSILIRGQTSIMGSNFPLVVLDDVIYSGSLTDINPSDIATIDVLKDAVSAAAYGSRSSNGIIIITTKKGKTSKPSITFNASTAFQQWQNKPEMMSGAQWLAAINAGNQYDAGSTFWMYPQVLANYEAGKETDWLDKVSRTGVVQSYQVAVSGAPVGVNYYLSTSYDENKGIVVGDQFNRISVMGKISTDITGWLQVGADANFTKKDYSGIPANIASAKTMIPYGSMYRDDLGNLEKFPREEGLGYINPLWGVDDGLIDHHDIRQNYRLNSYALLTAPWVEGLTYRFNFQHNLNQQEFGEFTHEGYFVLEGPVTNTQRYAPSTIQNYLARAGGRFDHYKTYDYVINNILNYNQSFNKHNIDATLVATRDYTMYESNRMSGSDFAATGNSSLGFWGLHMSSTPKVNLDATERSNIGYLARVNYFFNDKYYFTGSFRRDGASVFGENQKWGNFGAIGLAWRISSEPFLNNFEPLDDLKLKLSWGQNGNQGVSPYTTLAKIESGNTSGIRYEFSNTGSQIYYGLVQANMGNSYLGWELTEKWNAGFESAWLGNRLSLGVDGYLYKTTREIYTPTIPTMNGFTSITSSLGEVHNYGLEVALKTINIQNRDWSWNTFLTYWFNRNKLVHLDGQDLNGDGIEDDKIADGMFIGKPLYSIYGYVQDGIIQSGDDEYKAMEGAATVDGYPKYRDINNDGKISSADRRILGYPQERFRLNLSNTFSYKNLELYVMLVGVFGGGSYYLKSNLEAYMLHSNAGYDANMPYRPYWTPERPSNVYPAAFFKGDGGKFMGLQSRSFIRVQNIALSYTFNQEWLKKIKFNSLKIFCTANNPLIFTDWVGGDPEIGTTALSGSLPVASTYSFGLNTSF